MLSIRFAHWKSLPQVQRHESIEYSNFEPIMASILIEKVFKQYHRLLANKDHVNELIPQLEAKLNIYDTILSKKVRLKR